MKKISRAAVATALAFTAALAFGSARAADDYPKAPVHIICGFAPGTTADITARVVGAKMSQILGQQFVVENRAGAGSSLAADMVARGPKDGYVLFIGSAANLINAAMNPNLNFDFVKDFTPITLMSSTPTVLVVTPELGVKSVKDLIALAKSKPDTLSFGSAGVGSSTHMALELFKTLTQVKITHVPYQGSPPVVTDLLGGRLQGYFSPASSVMGHVKAGKLIALAVTDPKRSASFPDLPTMIEAGVPNYKSALWFGLVAPKGTPQAVIDKLSRAANEALKSDDVVKSFHEKTMAAIGGSPDDFAKYIAAEEKRWTQVVETAGLKTQKK